MERAFTYSWWLLTRACVVLGLAAVALGCHSACKDTKGKHGCSHPNLHLDNCSDIEQGAIPQPIGTFTGAYLNRQAMKAEGDDFVIYYNEWLDGKSELASYGSAHVARIAGRLPTTPFLVVVQPEPGYADLSAPRREVVVDTLLKAGIADAPARVVIARPRAEGLYGEEAERIGPRIGGIGGGGGIGNLGGGSGISGFAGGFGGASTGIGFR